jgi:hypothetical protein
MTVLAELQSLLHDVYELELTYDVQDFLLTDAVVARQLDRNGREVDEKLLICESDGEARVSLYLRQALVDRLHRRDPTRRLDEENLEDFWTAFEGVSHFTYFAWNATWERSVTLLEMELQAEVDKFIATSMLLSRQGAGAPADLHHWLFERPSFDHALTAAELDRYEAANRLAGLYCRSLVRRMADGEEGALRNELRRFYRLTQSGKIAHITARAAADRS